LHLFPLILLIFVLPLGVAAQNLAITVVSLIFAGIIATGGESYRLSFFKSDKYKPFLVPVVLSLLYLAWMIFATLLNPEHPTGSFAKFVGGYTAWAIFPSLAIFTLRGLQPKEWRTLYCIFSIIVACWGLVTLSQNIFGWRVVGMSFVEGPTRAQGFYSHPLTLAYSSIFLFPISIYRAVSKPKDFYSWPLLFGSMSIIFASQSRMIQAAAGIILIYNVLKIAKGKVKVAFLIAGILATLVVGVTDNKIKTRFLQTIDLKHDRHTKYADDRLAFWDVHLDMFKARPIVGHGPNLSTEYRIPWYQNAGFADLERKYPAHNLYLQIAVSGGVVALGIFLGWLLFFIRSAWKNREDEVNNIILQTLSMFCLASVTQNSIQDSEVRFALTLFITCVFLHRFQKTVHE
jgi:O-antigen ligase